MCERLVLFCKSNHDIYSFDTSPQINKTKKNGMIDVNLRSVAAATSAGGGLTLIKNICTSMDFPPPVNNTPYQRYLRFLEEKTIAD